MSSFQQVIKVLHGAVFIVDVVEVADIVPEVNHRGFEDRRHPYRVHSSIFEVLQVIHYTCKEIHTMKMSIVLSHVMTQELSNGQDFSHESG